MYSFQQREELEDRGKGDGGTAAVYLYAVLHANRVLSSGTQGSQSHLVVVLISSPEPSQFGFSGPRANPVHFPACHPPAANPDLHCSSPPPLPRIASDPHTSPPPHSPNTSASCCAPDCPPSSAFLIPSPKTLQFLTFLYTGELK